jgi:4'-phosphopantetheinyl transferase
MAVLEATGTTAVAAPVVEIWVLPAMLAGRCAERAWGVLSEAERTHARRLAPGALRDRWVARCYAVRRVLAMHLGVDESEVALLHNAEGRLCVAAANGTHVGVSSTHSRVVVALGEAQVGVDAEPLSAGRPEMTRRWTARGAMNKAARLDAGTDLDLYVEWRGGSPCVRSSSADGSALWSMTSLVVEDDTVVSVAVRVPAAKWNVLSVA